MSRAQIPYFAMLALTVWTLSFYAETFADLVTTLLDDTTELASERLQSFVRDRLPQLQVCLGTSLELPPFCAVDSHPNL